MPRKSMRKGFADKMSQAIEVEQVKTRRRQGILFAIYLRLSKGDDSFLNGAICRKISTRRRA